MYGSCLLVVDTTNHFSSVSDRALSVESSLSKMLLRLTYVFTGHTLANDFSVLVDENLRLRTLGVDASLGKCKKICGRLDAHFGCHHYFS
jgi:hypothetical protein